MSVGRFVLPVGVAGVRYHLGGILLVLALAFVVPTCVAALLGAGAGPSMDSFTSWRWVHRGFALDQVCERTPVRRV